MEYEEDYETIDAMETFGGSFVSALAKAARHADLNNFLRMKRTWPEYFEEYRKMAIVKKSKKKVKIIRNF